MRMPGGSRLFLGRPGHYGIMECLLLGLPHLIHKELRPSWPEAQHEQWRYLVKGPDLT
jgi:hypothetical protein